MCGSEKVEEQSWLINIFIFICKESVRCIKITGIIINYNLFLKHQDTKFDKNRAIPPLLIFPFINVKAKNLNC